MSNSNHKLEFASSNGIDYHLDIPLKEERIIFNLQNKNKSIIKILTEIKDHETLNKFELESREFCLSTVSEYTTQSTTFYDENSKLPNPKYIIFYYQNIDNKSNDRQFIFNDGQYVTPIEGTVIFFNSKENIKVNDIKDGFTSITIIKFF